MVNEIYTKDIDDARKDDVNYIIGYIPDSTKQTQ